jgi:dolichol-phosphate mannosyltransferase
LKSKTLIFTATYNEIDNVELLIKKIKKLKNKVDILVIDDNSPDGTGTKLLQLKKRNKNLDVIIRKGKQGLDTAHKIGFNYSKRKNYTNLITLDADLSHDPKEIPKMINILKKRPFVIGSRYMTGGKCNMSLPRLLLSIMGNKFIKFLLNISCHEFTTSYRGFNLRKLKNFNLTSVKAKGYSFFMETIYILNKRKFSIYEIPINFENRTHGKSKIPTLEIFRTLIRVFILSLRT